MICRIIMSRNHAQQLVLLVCVCVFYNILTNATIAIAPWQNALAMLDSIEIHTWPLLMVIMLRRVFVCACESERGRACRCISH